MDNDGEALCERERGAESETVSAAHPPVACVVHMTDKLSHVSYKLGLNKQYYKNLNLFFISSGDILAAQLADRLPSERIN